MSKMKTKTCTSCKSSKPLSEFHRDQYNYDGYTDRCRSCRCEVERQRREIREHNLKRAEEMGLLPKVKEILARNKTLA
jgi:hypothetical protein